MRFRLWYELGQAKFNEIYTCNLICHQRKWLNYFNLVITFFSTAGVMGWKIWNEIPVIACSIIAIISLSKLIQPHLIPSEKQIEKLDKVSDFYYDFYLRLEKIWFDFEKGNIDEAKMMELFHGLKQTEREINRILNEIHKSPNKKISKLSKLESDIFFKNAFNTL